MKSAARVGWIFFLMLLSMHTYAQSVGGGGKGGGGLRGEANSLRRGSGCVEGRRTLFYEVEKRSGNRVTVVRECQNGSYYDLSDYIYNPQTRCTEGRRETWTESDRWGDRVKSVTRICKNGKWIPYERKPLRIRWPWW
ncbi:hypothetical protein QJS83_01095 [Bdellovibrio sp. 22V]|uniref:hypothetical protein n=1 Tax=Bdellovibrio TaxID=958 RepID=UPI002542ADCD|nr:hypothetical protein [Bdellovibrio sp. 22V]WII72463.1 hypothetical protein QJS83_01095 [Bdellovibrio sp. 22V]